jgi:hypothetical protein
VVGWSWLTWVSRADFCDALGTESGEPAVKRVWWFFLRYFVLESDLQLGISCGGDENGWVWQG